MDERQLEMAEELENLQRTVSISTASRAAAPERHPDFDGTHCVDCSGDIPDGRLALGKVRCVYCQTALEKRNAHSRT